MQKQEELDEKDIKVYFNNNDLKMSNRREEPINSKVDLRKQLETPDNESDTVKDTARL